MDDRKRRARRSNWPNRGPPPAVWRSRPTGPPGTCGTEGPLPRWSTWH